LCRFQTLGFHECFLGEFLQLRLLALQLQAFHHLRHYLLSAAPCVTVRVCSVPLHLYLGCLIRFNRNQPFEVATMIQTLVMMQAYDRGRDASISCSTIALVIAMTLCFPHDHQGHVLKLRDG
jgi:hypothetical protein